MSEPAEMSRNSSSPGTCSERGGSVPPGDEIRIAVFGGSLQGTEVLYLARKAGWRTLLVDRNEQAPARTLADRFVCAEIERIDAPRALLQGCRLMVPALEDDGALECLQAISRETGVPLAHDPEAYAVSSSKVASDDLFRRLGVPAPRPHPSNRFPVIAKPDRGSGSRGVRVFADEGSLSRWLSGRQDPHRWVIQEFIQGPTFSVEVVGNGGEYAAGPVTDLHMDADYDCKRVTAPSELAEFLQERTAALALRLAGALTLRGIMDLEVVFDGRDILALEIDARFPSQTPTVVYWSEGVNLLEILGRMALNPESPPRPCRRRVHRAVLYEHVQVRNGRLYVAGEHVMAKAKALRVVPGFFGSREAVTDHVPGAREWVATLIFVSDRLKDVWAQHHRALERMVGELGLKGVEDSMPYREGEGVGP
jgi:pyrrolysine biosynthesis protein PylC